MPIRYTINPFSPSAGHTFIVRCLSICLFVCSEISKMECDRRVNFFRINYCYMEGAGNCFWKISRGQKWLSFLAFRNTYFILNTLWQIYDMTVCMK